MRVLHIFDKYLNTTMNWAAELLRNTSGVEHHIAAPWIVENSFYYPEFQYHYGPWQNSFRKYPKSEWEGGWQERLVRGLESKTGWWLKRLEQQEFDLIHAHFGPVGVKALPLAKRTGKPLVVSFYGYDVKKAIQAKPQMHRSYHELFQVASCIHTTGHSLRQKLIELGCPPEKIQLISLNIDPDSVIKKTAAPKRVLQFVQVCSITEKKGIEDTVKAFARLNKSFPETKLSLIGEVVEENVYQNILKLMKECEIEKAVEIQGFVDNYRVKQILHNYDVFVHPSYQTGNGDMEGLPVSMKEAMAAGLPVITTRHSDIPDAVIHGVTGFLCDEREIECLYRYMEFFVSLSPQLYHSMSEAACRMICDNYSINVSGNQLFLLYKNLIS